MAGAAAGARLSVHPQVLPSRGAPRLPVTGRTPTQLSEQTLPSPTQQVLSPKQGCLPPPSYSLFSVAETQPVMTSPMRSFEMKSPILESVEFPGAVASL